MSIHVPSMKYERYNIEKIENFMKAKLAEIERAESADDLLRVRREIIDESVEFSNAVNISYVRFTQNTRDEFYLKEKDYYDEVEPVYSDWHTKYIKAIIASPYKDEFFKKLPATIRPMYENTIKSFDDRIIRELRQEAQLVTEYSKLMSEMSFEFKGEKMPLSMLRKYFEDENRDVRRDAYEVLGKVLNENSEALDGIYDKLVKLRDTMAKKMGYKNYVEMGYYRMGRIGYGRADVERMRENILRDVVPVVSKIRTERAKEIGIDDMKLYDLDCIFADGEPVPAISATEMFEAAKTMYHEMNENTADFIDEMIENEAFDYESRDGKWGGGYQTEFPKYKQMFILANFNGTSGDVDVLTHEGGHAFAGYMAYKNNIDEEAGIGGMETAETHSMSMEFFCWKWMRLFFKENENKYKYKHLLDSFSFLTYGIIVDAFQHIVYENPELTPAERNAEWLKLEKRFRPYINVDGMTYLEKGTRWQYQMHIYEMPFYYIDYVIAQSSALQFLIASQKDYDKAFKAYYELLSKGGEKEYPVLMKEAGLKSPFDDGALKEVAEETAKLLEKIKPQ